MLAVQLFSNAPWAGAATVNSVTAVLISVFSRLLV